MNVVWTKYSETTFFCVIMRVKPTFSDKINNIVIDILT